MTTSKKKLETGLVRELAEILREADLGEIEIEHEGLRIRVSRPELSVTALAPPAMAAPPTTAPVAAPAERDQASDTASPSIPDGAITSPMVGTVYLAPEPGAKPFIKTGDKVSKGDTLMLVEAMKTFNPVTAPEAGTVREIYVNDAQPVEFGEPLILID